MFLTVPTLKPVDKGEGGGVHKTKFTLPLFIEMSVSSLECEQSCTLCLSMAFAFFFLFLRMFDWFVELFCRKMITLEESYHTHTHTPIEIQHWNNMNSPKKKTKRKSKKNVALRITKEENEKKKKKKCTTEKKDKNMAKFSKESISLFCFKQCTRHKCQS